MSLGTLAKCTKLFDVFKVHLHHFGTIIYRDVFNFLFLWLFYGLYFGKSFHLFLFLLENITMGALICCKML